MEIIVYSGMDRTSILFQSELSRYTVTDTRLSCSLSTGFAKLPFKTDDLITVDIKDSINGDLSFLTTFTSYNYVVYNRPENTDTVVGDNSLLFKIILQY